MRCRAIWLVFIALVCGCGTSSTETPMQSAYAPQIIGGNVLVADLPAPPASRDGDTQLIAANDVLLVDFFGVDQLDRTVQVDGRGHIALPLVGNLAAAGISQRELETAIASAYARDYLQSPQVSVFVKESAGQRVTIDGEVNRAGLYPVTASTTLLQVLAQAGNVNEIGNARQVLVFRPVGNQRMVASYDVEAARAGRAADPAIFGGDLIVVPSSAARIARHNLKDMLGVASSVGRLATLGL